MHLKMLSGKRWPFCLSLNMLRNYRKCKYEVMILKIYSAWQRLRKFCSLCPDVNLATSTWWKTTGLAASRVSVMAIHPSVWVPRATERGSSSRTLTQVRWDLSKYMALQKWDYLNNRGTAAYQVKWNMNWKCSFWKIMLTHCSVMTTYGNINPGQNWSRIKPLSELMLTSHW